MKSTAAEVQVRELWATHGVLDKEACQRQFRGMPTGHRNGPKFFYSCPGCKEQKSWEALWKHVNAKPECLAVALDQRDAIKTDGEVLAIHEVKVLPEASTTPVERLMQELRVETPFKSNRYKCPQCALIMPWLKMKKHLSQSGHQGTISIDSTPFAEFTPVQEVMPKPAPRRSSVPRPPANGPPVSQLQVSDTRELMANIMVDSSLSLRSASGDGMQTVSADEAAARGGKKYRDYIAMMPQEQQGYFEHVSRKVHKCILCNVRVPGTIGELNKHAKGTPHRERVQACLKRQIAI
eukprot:CAMPEP_0119316386 /NCGR_PEP_ID=MMETSP1333-20130426/39505_1 /TAXON_ID=418940 /ORGANISM="Scyphosphaera apsteinii, Strain RCC1455" /LENGTH=293 /DNA_ID=CAMNT_0007322021 /DNA_START=148 /DNA_END=1029 /DNA_ORIENTATION=-